MKRFLLAVLALVPTAALAGSMMLGMVGGTGTFTPPAFVPSCTASQSFFTRAASNIAAAVTAGAPGISAWQTATDGLICGLASASLNTSGTVLLSLVDVLYFNTAPTPQLAAMNLVSSSFGETLGAGMATFVPNAGITGAANTTGFADTGYKPSSGQMTTSSLTIGACVINARTTLMTSSFLSEVGTQSTGPTNAFVVDILTGAAAAQASLFQAGGTAGIPVSSGTLGSTRGGFFVSRTAAALATAYANGTSLGTVNNTLGTIAAPGNFFVLGLNNNGAPFAPGGLPDTNGAVILGGGMTQAQVFAVEALLDTALKAVGTVGCGLSTAASNFILPTGSSLKFISPTGSDSNDGLAATVGGGHGPWLTPGHAVKCGDVIIASAGNYTAGQFGQNNWGAVTGCPSTTGGIDGTGGVYFATVLCAGPVITSCSIAPSSGEATRVDASNWAVEGFTATSTGTCFSITSESSGVVIHHVAFINDIASGCTSSGFNSYSWNGVTSGVDQTAVVGAIAYNAASSAISGNCTSGISLIPSNGPDTSAGTHVFVAGYFGYKNVNGSGCDAPGQTTDGNGVIFDSWACGQYNYQGVVEQTVVWANGAAGVEVFPNCTNADDLATYIVKSTTSYGNYKDNNHQGNQGELALQNITPSTGSYSVTGSIFQATTLQTNGGAVYKMVALEGWCTNACTPKVSVTGNYGWQSNPGSIIVAGNFNTDAYVSGSHNTTTWPFGTNTYNDAGFASPGSLPSTAPSCGAYANTTDCMVAAGVPANLTPSGGAAGLGYKVPGACTADALYPTWLKGVVYLQWNGASLTENAGLVTKPCGI